jgi:transcriptional regulator with XRE-family HTH domain
MESKSLRVLANELDVSASYLSQVKNGTRPPSRKLLKKLEGCRLIDVKQVLSNRINQDLLEKSLEIVQNEPESGCNSAVECLLPKQKVASSNLVTRSTKLSDYLPRSSSQS